LHCLKQPTNRQVKRKRGRPKKTQPEAAPQTPQVPETPAAPEVLGAETPEIAGQQTTFF